MRVISGTAKGTKINTIDSSSTRPTLDRVKESLFNILQDVIRGAVVLDLFAGSGALGIEALSRGADKAIFCDINKDATNVIEANLNKTHLSDKAVVFSNGFEKTLQTVYKNKTKFDIIFIDPPYRLNIAEKAVRLISDYKLLTDDGIIVIETDDIIRDENMINTLIESKEGVRLHISDKRKYGRAYLIFLKLNLPSSEA